MERIKCIYGYLAKMKHGVICIHVSEPDYSDLPDQDFDWMHTVYGELSEILPSDAPEPLGEYVTLTHYVDANLMHDITTKGVGLAPGTADNMYSGQAEAFGLLAALLFLAHYIESFGPHQFQDSPINCYCDNIGVITRTTKKLETTIVQPNDMMADDSDVYMALEHTIQ